MLPAGAALLRSCFNVPERPPSVRRSAKDALTGKRDTADAVASRPRCRRSSKPSAKSAAGRTSASPTLRDEGQMRNTGAGPHPQHLGIKLIRQLRSERNEVVARPPEVAVLAVAQVAGAPHTRDGIHLHRKSRTASFCKHCGFANLVAEKHIDCLAEMNCSQLQHIAADMNRTHSQHILSGPHTERLMHCSLCRPKAQVARVATCSSCSTMEAGCAPPAASAGRRGTPHAGRRGSA